MGHTNAKFEGLLEEFKGVKKHTMGTKSVLDMVKALTETVTTMDKLETHCFEFAHEFLKNKSGNFTQTALNFEVDGVVAKYHCSRDDRTYTVKITASK